NNCWERCKFLGTYWSCQFGQLQSPFEYESEKLDGFRVWTNPWGRYLVKECDFSQARMHYCAFENCDVSTMKFPRWPCFTILDPARNRDDFAEIDLPFRKGVLRANLSCGNPVPPRDKPNYVDAMVYIW